MEAIPVILLGLIIGSFLNVLILRIPRGLDVVFARSQCPLCQNPIRFYDNIPILSFLILRGRCRSCRQAISWQYPLVEGATAFSFWLLYRHFGLTFHAGLAALFICLLIVLALIDLNHMILPNTLTLGGSAVFLVYAFFNPFLPLLDALLTALGAVLVFGGLYLFYLKIRKIEGLGLGDVKMAFFLGLFLGHRHLTIAVILASFLGLMVGLYFILFQKKNLRFALPFGTFLGIGGFLSLFWGDTLFELMFHLSHLHA